MDKTKELILTRAESYVRRYHNINSGPTPLRLLSMRCSKACNKIGIDLVDLLTSDTRFEVIMSKASGATEVWLADDFEAFADRPINHTADELLEIKALENKEVLIKSDAQLRYEALPLPLRWKHDELNPGSKGLYTDASVMQRPERPKI